MRNFAFLINFFYFYFQYGKKILITKGFLKKISWDKGVSKVSGRRGDLDFTLREGGNGTFPPSPQ